MSKWPKFIIFNKCQNGPNELQAQIDPSKTKPRTVTTVYVPMRLK